MRIIAHRANLNGPILERENHPDAILEALDRGFDVEIDVWRVNDAFLLGHDGPAHTVDKAFLLRQGLWVHAKNLDAMAALKDETNCFFHDVDDAVFTSRNFIWVYPGKPLPPGSVCVSPEKADYPVEALAKCYAICTDYPQRYEALLAGLC